MERCRPPHTPSVPLNLHCQARRLLSDAWPSRGGSDKENGNTLPRGELLPQRGPSHPPLGYSRREAPAHVEFLPSGAPPDVLVAPFPTQCSWCTFKADNFAGDIFFLQRLSFMVAVNQINELPADCGIHLFSFQLLTFWSYEKMKNHC